MRPQIVIAGYGYVGKAVHSVLTTAKIVDPKYNKETISAWWNKPGGVITVSYTHLTLPTNREV